MAAVMHPSAIVFPKSYSISDLFCSSGVVGFCFLIWGPAKWACVLFKWIKDRWGYVARILCIRRTMISIYTTIGYFQAPLSSKVEQTPAPRDTFFPFPLEFRTEVQILLKMFENQFNKSLNLWENLLKIGLSFTQHLNLIKLTHWQIASI